MARASYQHIPNLVLGGPKPKKAKSPDGSKKTTVKASAVKGATFSPSSTPYSSPVFASYDALMLARASGFIVPREPKPLLKLKY